MEEKLFQKIKELDKRDRESVVEIKDVDEITVEPINSVRKGAYQTAAPIPIGFVNLFKNPNSKCGICGNEMVTNQMNKSKHCTVDRNIFKE